MALEDLTGTKYIDDLNSSNPAAGDNVSEGDDHIRGIKNVLKTTFPNIDGAVNATDTDLSNVLPTTGGTMTGDLTLGAYSDTSAISDNAVDIFVYDTSKDSDGGAWRKRCQHTSWYNEAASSTRGSRKEFPAVAVIVAETGTLTIYDGDTPDLDMWMIINTSSGGIFSSTTGSITSITAKNSRVYAGKDSTQGLHALSFLEDVGWRHGTSNVYTDMFLGNILDRNTNNGFSAEDDSHGGNIVSNVVNDVAMTVLPNAPIDSATGLPIPTIAVATDGGVSVIKDDGSVVDITHSSTSTIQELAIGDDYTLYVSQPNSTVFGAVSYGPLPTADVDLNSWRYTQFYPTVYPNIPSDDVTHITAKAFGFTQGLVPVIFNTSEPNKSSTALVTSKYNTGYMTGDIKGAWLSDTDATDVTATELVTNGTFDSDLSGWSDDSSGTGTATQSAGRASLYRVDSSNRGKISQSFTLVSGKTYLVSFEIISGNLQVHFKGGSGTASQYFNGVNWNVASTGVYQTTFVASGTDGYASFMGISDGVTGVVDNISVRLADADRSVNDNGLQVFGTVDKDAVATDTDSTGDILVGYSGFSSSNYLEQPYNSDLDFGTGDYCLSGWTKLSTAGTEEIILDFADNTTNRIFLRYTTAGAILFYCRGTAGTSSTTSNLAVDIWHHIAAFRANGVQYIYVDGILHDSDTCADDPTHSSGVLRFGTDSLTSSNTPATNTSLALWRISATAPSAEQIKDIYEAEKVLFQDNANCTLNGSSDAVTAMDYDDYNDELLVGTSGGLSVFKGLRRVDENTNAITEVAQQGGLRVEEY